MTQQPARAKLGAAMFVALVTMAIGMVGLVQPDALTALRRSYFATPARVYVAGAVRLLMGVVLIAAASSPRWPRLLRVFGILMCLQALSATTMGPERARAVLEWETLHATLLRVGAVIALATGALMAAAVTPQRSRR